MGDRPAPVLWSKLRVPTSTVATVQRQRLLELLVPAGRGPSVWVLHAPGGFGKTTLASHAVGRRDGATFWMTVDERDRDEHRFWTHVVAGLGELGVEVSNAVAALDDGPIDSLADEVVAALDAFRAPLTLVFDDVHEISGSAPIAGLERIIAAAVDGVTVAVLTRRELELPLPRLRTHGDLVELTSESLAYTLDEVKALLRPDVEAGRISPADVVDVARHLDRWPAGVRLAQLAIRVGGAPHVMPDFGGAHPDVAAYLAGEVVDRLEPTVREFLVRTSILVDLTPGACDAVVGRPGSLAVLRRLAADDVFTSLVDPATSTFRLHRVLREFARSRFDELAPTDRDEHHRRAHVWYRRNGDTDAALRHAVSANEHGLALDAMAEAYIETAAAGGIDTLWRWVGMIGAERVLRHPLLGPLPAWASLNQFRYDDIEPWLQAIELVDEISDGEREGFDVQAAAIRTHRDRHLGHLDRSLEHGLRAMELVRPDGDPLVGSSALAGAGAALALVGDPRAETVLRSAISMAQETGETSGIVTGYSYLALVVDDVDESVAASDTALGLMTDDAVERFHRPAAAWLASARASRSRGRVRDAEHAIARGLVLARSGDEPILLALLEAERARLAHLRGDDEVRRAALREAERLSDGLSGADAVIAAVTSARNDTRFAPVAADDLLAAGARELTERELAVLRLLPLRLTRRELARQLYVSENTVKTHLTAIRRKLGVSGRDDIVERARAVGLLDDPH